MAVEWVSGGVKEWFGEELVWWRRGVASGGVNSGRKSNYVNSGVVG